MGPFSLTQPSHLSEEGAGREGEGAAQDPSEAEVRPRPSHTLHPPPCSEREHLPDLLLCFSGNAILHVTGEDP